jgi:hypothetical protein
MATRLQEPHHGTAAPFIEAFLVVFIPLRMNLCADDDAHTHTGPWQS